MRMWILGAPDPEMQRIEDLLADLGEQVAHALDATGQRVHPGSAYRAVALSAPVPEGATVYAVECGGPAVPAGAVVIDHHRPGDPGYGRPPAEFLAASSIGQVIAELADVWPARYRTLLDRLGWPMSTRWTGDGPPQWDGPSVAEGGPAIMHIGRRFVYFGLREDGGWAVHVPRGFDETGGSSDWIHVPQAIVLAAAADHCLAAAYRGECPGVEPDDLMRWRTSVRAAHQDRPVEDLLAEIEQARARLLAAPVLELGDPSQVVRDLRGQFVPELPEAAARERLAYLAIVADRDGREKVVLGAASPDTVRAFLERWAPEQGLIDLYGDPARGFAGGYVAGAEATGRMDG